MLNKKKKNNRIDYVNNQCVNADFLLLQMCQTKQMLMDYSPKNKQT